MLDHFIKKVLITKKLSSSSPLKRARTSLRTILPSQKEAGSAINVKTITSRAENSATDARKTRTPKTKRANPNTCPLYSKINRKKPLRSLLKELNLSLKILKTKTVKWAVTNKVVLRKKRW